MLQNSEREKYNPWSLEYNDYDSRKEKSRETLLTIGNGYLGSRGALEETTASETNYPGTYIAGLYNRLLSKVADRDVENEDFVNCPNWFFLNFRIDNSEWLDINKTEIISIRRKLDFLNGSLSKELIVKDSKGRKTKVTSKRIASMANPHLVALQYKIQPLNYSGSIEIKSVIDGNIINGGVSRYNDLNQNHLKPNTQGNNDKICWLSVNTTQSEIEIAQAAKLLAIRNGKKETGEFSHNLSVGEINSVFNATLDENEELTIEKIAAIYTSKSDDVNDPLTESKKIVSSAGEFETILKESEFEWAKIWEKIDIQIEGDTKSQMLIRLHLYHLMVTASPNNVNIDAGIPARGLHGEAYRGHIFWDELYIMPLYNLFFPDVAKSILNYRFRRIDKAREYAKEFGYKGAMFAWQSGSDGREETQTIHMNPISGIWGDDYSSLQPHISIAIAYNTWYYFQVTNDIGFMEESGAELFLEICRFWASKSTFDKTAGRYSISKVMGPDEFHEKHKASKSGGVKDNAYTNIMVAWLFSNAFEILEKLPKDSKEKLTSKINLGKAELKEWREISENLNIPVSKEGIIEQFDGYFELDELDWDAYRKKYTTIYRLDRILKAEGKSPDDYKLAKQADTLMTFYNLDEEDVSDLVKNSGSELPADYLERNYNYYLKRTSHGSTLSRVVHAYLANIFGDKELGGKLYFEALESDFTDIQGGTTAEGIHAGVMGGTVLMAITSFAGINFKKEYIKINPALPKKWSQLKFNFTFKSNHYFVDLSHNKLNVEIKSNNSSQIKIEFSNKKIILSTNEKYSLDY
ncbi:MAG: beta-phosphoglucomutase [Draconibacterium sp.]|nr:beta-phosphoglucomutase [Draconibacterium sp.]